MKSLRSRISELDRILRGHQEDAAEKLAVGATRKASSDLNQHVETLTALTSAIRELRRANIDLEAPAALQSLRDAIEDARDEAVKDGLAPGRGDQPIVLRLTKSLVADIKTQVVPAWQRLQQGKPIPVVDEELLELAAESESSLLDRHERAKTVLTLLREKREPKEGDIERWSTSVDTLRDVATKVAELAPSAEVRDFLSAASSRDGATLESLDVPEVREWLAIGGRSSRFRIRAQGQ